jgi:hypothetical protein
MSPTDARHFGDGSPDWAVSRSAPARITDRRRVLITRAQLARLSGLSTSTLAVLYVNREDNGHPPAVYRDPAHGVLYFDEIDALRWHRSRHRARRSRP